MATHVQFEVEVKDVEYQQQAGKPWLARVYRPIGAGPFPTIVDVHGGAWNNGDRTNATTTHPPAAAAARSAAGTATTRVARAWPPGGPRAGAPPPRPPPAAAHPDSRWRPAP